MRRRRRSPSERRADADEKATSKEHEFADAPSRPETSRRRRHIGADAADEPPAVERCDHDAAADARAKADARAEADAPPDARRLFSLRSTPFFNPYFSWWGGTGWWY